MRKFCSLGVATLVLGTIGCEPSYGPEQHQPGAHQDAGAGGGGGCGGGGDGTSGGGNNGGGTGNGPGCVGLQCQQVACNGGPPTTLTGRVFAPDGITPLYNAIVYVPNTPPGPFSEGVSCDR